jgi:hypothetical protein
VAGQKIAGTQPNRPIPAGFVEIAHDGIDGTTRVDRKALAHWEARGWHETTTATPAAPDKTLAPRRGAPTGQES